MAAKKLGEKERKRARLLPNLDVRFQPAESEGVTGDGAGAMWFNNPRHIAPYGLPAVSVAAPRGERFWWPGRQTKEEGESSTDTGGDPAGGGPQPCTAPPTGRQGNPSPAHRRQSSTPLADFLLNQQGEEMSGRKRELLQLWLARRGLSLEDLEDRSAGAEAEREGGYSLSRSAHREWRDPTE